MKKQKSRKTTIISAVIFFFFTACVTAYILSGNGENGVAFETVKAEIGNVVNTVTATGTLEATNTVIVGTQVSGVIEKIYVDFNSRVKKGQIIAEIDKSILQSNLENVEAAMYNAQAEVDYQKSNFERMKLVFDKGMLSDKDYDLAKYQFNKSEASYKSAGANLNKARLNLSYATIYSPIDGIVINRAVEEGQTVAASMNTPELFTITNNLSEMQVEANVDEADIGMVKENQRVEFTVDAFPDKTFSGTVTEVRLKPKEAANVITYTVIVSAQNPDLELKPGMTASITIYVQEVSDVLILAGKALRFSPDRQLMQEYMKSLPEGQGSFSGRQGAAGLGRKGANGNGKGQNMSGKSENSSLVWVKSGDEITPARVKTGVTDGTNIEILSGLNAGDEVVTTMKVADKKNTAETKKETQKSPFIPERPGGGKGQGPGQKG